MILKDDAAKIIVFRPLCFEKVLQRDFSVAFAWAYTLIQNTPQKVSVFGVILVHIFQHSN